MNWIYHDPGGRAEPELYDCFTRACSIALNYGYSDVWSDLSHMAAMESLKGRQGRSHPDKGINHRVIEAYMKLKNWKWVAGPFKWSELPKRGTVIVYLKWHLAAVVNGVLHDTYDSSRNGKSKVYGYYKRG